MTKLYLKDRKNFEVLLAERGWNYGDLASEVGIGRTYLSKIVNGGPIGKKTAKAIADEFDTKLLDIFFASDVDKSYTK